MAKRSNDVDASVAAGNKNGRQVAGTSYAYSKADGRSGKEFPKGMVVKKGGAKGGPAAATKSNRAPISQDRLGPRFAIGVKLPGPQAPEASYTQNNTIMRPSINRSSVNFNYGRQG